LGLDGDLGMEITSFRTVWVIFGVVWFLLQLAIRILVQVKHDLQML